MLSIPRYKHLFACVAISTGALLLPFNASAIGLDNIPDGTVITEGVVDFSEAEAKYNESKDLPLHVTLKRQIEEIKGGLTALFQGDYELALSEFKASAVNGNGMAQNSVGIMYEKGFGTPPNNQEAVAWYQTAISHGNIDAVYNLAVLFFEGPPGVPQNLPRCAESPVF